MVNKIIDYEILTNSGVLHGQFEFVNFYCEGVFNEKEKAKRMKFNESNYKKVLTRLIKDKKVLNLYEREKKIETEAI